MVGQKLSWWMRQLMHTFTHPYFQENDQTDETPGIYLVINWILKFQGLESSYHE